MGWQAQIDALRRAIAADPSTLPSPIASAAFAFVDLEAYANGTYASTSRALSTLEQTLGPTRFAAAMQSYAQAWAWKHPTGHDLFEVLSAKFDEDLSWFFGPVWQGVGGLQLGIRTAACHLAHPPRGVFGEGSARKVVTEVEAPDSGTYVCEIVVTSTGTIHVPFEIELRFADDSTKRVHWEDRGHAAWERFVVERSSPLVEVWLDPDDKLALDSPIKHHYRLEGDGAASLRAAAWIAQGTQTLLQVVGP